MAILESEPHSSPRNETASARPSRPTCQGASGTASPSSAASPSITATPCSPSEASVPAAPPNCTTQARGRSWSSRSTCASSGASQVASFSPKVTGSACCRCVRPAISVPRCASACRASAAATATSSARTSASPSRTCSAVAESMMSWVVAPQCVQPPWAPAASDSPATTPTTG